MSVRVVIIDDSAMVRRILSEILDKEPDIEVAGAGPDPFVGRDLIVEHDPDVVLLDMEMPRMDGLTFLRKLMHSHPMPVVVVSSLTTSGSELALEALRSGAVEIVSKPGAAYSLGEMAVELPGIVRAAATSTPQIGTTDSPRDGLVASLALAPATNKIAAIGASTGGTTAIERVLTGLPEGAPGILIVQHIPASFGDSFAKRLDQATGMRVKTAEDREVVTPGEALLAPGGVHMVVRRSGALYRVHLQDEPSRLRHRPAVDVLFQSVATEVGRNAIGVLLTGMGEDGARGLLSMREAGARTVAQDEGSCVVYGMPKSAYERGAAEAMLPLNEMPTAIMDFASGNPLAGAPSSAVAP